jgi:hypothetical protein
MTIDHSRTTARIVHEIPPQAQFAPPTPRAPWKLELGELLALTATLSEAGYDTGEIIAKIEALSAGVNQATTYDIDAYLADDLLSLTPDEAAERVRRAALDLAADAEMERVRSAFEDALARTAGQALHEHSPALIEQMRKRYSPALDVVQHAADLGLRPDQDTAVLLDSGSSESIEAYRALGPATAELDRIANLRVQMCQVAGIGPTAHPVACFLASTDETHPLEGAENLWRGDLEHVQYDLPMTGSHIARVQRHRLGGPWLALVAAGYTVRLNDADEAEAAARGEGRAA